MGGAGAIRPRLGGNMERDEAIRFLIAGSRRVPESGIGGDYRKQWDEALDALKPAEEKASEDKPTRKRRGGRNRQEKGGTDRGVGTSE